MKLEQLIFKNWDQIHEVLRKHIPWRKQGNSHSAPHSSVFRVVKNRERKPQEQIEFGLYHNKIKRC